MLGKDEIISAMAGPLEQRLVVSPLLEQDQIGAVSIDLRLGSEFVSMRRANLSHVAPTLRKKEASRWQEAFLVPRRGNLVLHPGELILGCTFEYLCLPQTLGGYVTSRSSWGRVGLIIATAVAVAPGYRGVVTLELTNVGAAPLELTPGVRIAQILFHRTSGGVAYDGRYRCPTRPEMGKIGLDKDLGFWSAPGVVDGQ